MDLKDLPAYLEVLRNTAASAVTPAADNMASGVQDRMKNVTLKQQFHPPYTFYRAIPENSPAYASGNLAQSIMMTPASGSVRASASVGSHLIYSAIQEWGGWTVPNQGRYMHWRNPRPWWRKRVVLPPHPYFRPTVDSMIRDGSLTRLAMDGFYKRIAPLFHP